MSMQINAHPARESDRAEAQATTIVVGFDGSEESVDALAAAATRAGQSGKIIAVHAAEPASAWLDTPYYDDAVLRRQQRARRLFDALSNLDLDNVTVEVELVDGPAPQALAAVATQRDAREIIIGSRGLGRFRAAMSSVSHRLLRIADRPVVVVPKVRIGAPAHPRHA
jgi:nucleotide-binding universal stress UspA family protein